MSSLRTQGPIRRGFSVAALCSTACFTTGIGGYGSLRSQGRRKSGACARPTKTCHTRARGYPVRRGFSVPSLPSLEYWIARSSRATTAEDVAQRRIHRRSLLIQDVKQQHTPSRSRGAFRPGFAFCLSSSPKRGRRESRVRAAPAVSRAKLCKKAHTSIQVQRKQSGLPCAMVLTVSFGLSPVIGLFCHRRLRMNPQT